MVAQYRLSLCPVDLLSVVLLEVEFECFHAKLHELSHGNALMFPC